MRDHLGSVTKSGGNEDWQDMRFDPYGSRIASAPPPTPISDDPSSRVRLGFTGQEEDDDLALVNMNGRIYDPTLGRFLTPDPLVSMRSPSQSWNRYSYADNSPLRFVDPSGFIGEDGSSGSNGSSQTTYQPGPWLSCGQFSGCTSVAYGGFSGNYASSGGGPAVLSGDEAGGGASSAQASSTTGTLGGPSQEDGQQGGVSGDAESDAYSGRNAHTRIRAPLEFQNLAKTTVDGVTTVSFDVSVGATSTTTEYYGGASRDTPVVDSYEGSTLGKHEDLHADSLKRWWTTDNVRSVMGERGMATSFTVPAGTSNATIMGIAQSQLDNVGWTLTKMSNAYQALTIDNKLFNLPVPFYGLQTYRFPTSVGVLSYGQ
ncbi:MAG TPA: RHS repeat-associated core domain-containing protein, partial [Polyangia bacterium]|nr:RHS repeat-associated core domain-containing protein [Polyangia bacterium]